jgi:hypothetical protein
LSKPVQREAEANRAPCDFAMRGGRFVEAPPH